MLLAIDLGNTNTVFGVYDAATGRLDMHRLKPVGRLTGNLYSHIHDIFEMKRPSENYRG